MADVAQILSVYGEVARAQRVTEGGLGRTRWCLWAPPSTAARSPSPQVGRI